MTGVNVLGGRSMQAQLDDLMMKRLFDPNNPQHMMLYDRVKAEQQVLTTSSPPPMSPPPQTIPNTLMRTMTPPQRSDSTSSATLSRTEEPATASHTGHIYGTLTMTGDAKAVCGNVYDKNTPKHMRKTNKYGNAKIEKKANLIRGDVPIAAMQGFWARSGDAHQGMKRRYRPRRKRTSDSSRQDTS